MSQLPQVVPFRFGETKWEDYARDIQIAIYDASRAQIHSSQTASEASAVRLQELQLEMNWGFTLLHDQMEAHLRQLQEISGQLDRIAENTGFPRRTEAREAFGEGMRRIRQGLLAKGIEKLLEAESINDVDFLLQLQLGKIYLYGRDADEDVRDLDQAEQHLLLAVQYSAAAARDLGPRAHSFEAEARYHLAVLAYLRGSEIRQVDASGSKEFLRKAVGLVDSSPSSDRSHRFFLARCHALLGHVQEALKILVDLADEDRSIMALATREPDFQALYPRVPEVAHIARTNPGPATAAAFTVRDVVVSRIARIEQADPSGAFTSALQEAETRLRILERRLDSGEIRTEQYRILQSELAKELNTIGRKAVVAITNPLQRKREELEATIKEERKIMAQNPTQLNEVPGLVIAAAILSTILVAAIGGLIPLPDAASLALVIVSTIGMTGGYLIWEDKRRSRARERIREVEAERKMLMEEVEQFEGRYAEFSHPQPEQRDARSWRR